MEKLHCLFLRKCWSSRSISIQFVDYIPNEQNYVGFQKRVYKHKQKYLQDVYPIKIWLVLTMYYNWKKKYLTLNSVKKHQKSSLYSTSTILTFSVWSLRGLLTYLHLALCYCHSDVVQMTTRRRSLRMPLVRSYD